MSDVADDEVLHRRIHPLQVRPDGSPCSAAFTDPEMSVDRARYRQVEETLNGHPGYGAAGLIAGFVRSLSQEVRAVPELLNKGHALVVGKKSKSTRRKLAGAATWVVRPRMVGKGLPGAEDEVPGKDAEGTPD